MGSEWSLHLPGTTSPSYDTAVQFLVLGASGGCGQWVVRLAHARGHDVSAIKREASPYQPPRGVEVVTGEVTEPAFLVPLLERSDSVISCLGLRRAGKSPWAKLQSPPDLVQRVASTIGEVFGGDVDRRLVWLSAGGAGSSRSSASAFVKRLTECGNVGVAYRDLEAAEESLDHTAVRHLAVRPVTLTPGAPDGRATPIARYRITSTIRRSNVAQWMIDVADGTRRHDCKDVLLGQTLPLVGGRP